MALTKDAEKLNSLFLQLCDPKVVQRAAQKAIELIVSTDDALKLRYKLNEIAPYTRQVSLLDRRVS